VADRITAEQLAELSTLDRKLGTATRARRVADIERLEFEFHRTVNLLAESRQLSFFLRTATRYTPGRFLLSDPGWRETMRTDHEALLAAFGAGDPAAARAAMSRHFTDGADRLVKHLDDVGFWA
jgi:DNA-binding GntR family transcriptional regulator